MKRFLKILCCLAVSLTLSVLYVCAVSENGFVFTDGTDFSEEQISQLNEKASAIFDKYGVEVYFAKDFGYNTSSELGIHVLENSGTPEKGIIFANTQQHYSLDAFGGLQDIFTHDVTTWIYNTCSAKESYFDRAELYYAEVEQYLEFVAYPTVFNDPDPAESSVRLVDGQGLLTADEFNRVSEKLNYISETLGMDIAILTTDSLDGVNDKAFSEKYYEENNYGIGDTKSGILLTYDSVEGFSYIYTKGFGNDTVTDRNRPLLMDTINAELNNNGYENAFILFADKSSEYYNALLSGERTEKNGTTNIIVFLASAVALSVLIIIIVRVSSKKRKTKNK